MAGQTVVRYLIAGVLLFAPVAALAEEPVAIAYSRATLEQRWQARIQSFLDRGMIPLIDLESSLRPGDGAKYLKDATKVMDRLGVALMSFDGYQAKRTSKSQKGYRWSYYIHTVVNAYPDHFILATNGGTNKNWFRRKESFIRQTEEQVRTGNYPIMGEFEFRHYLSGSECRQGRTDRDIDIPVDSENGERLFRLSAETGVAFLIHNEPEDHALETLEKMLKAYPRARVIQAHFGQIRHPEKERRFGPALVRRLLSSYHNLYYDLSVGKPGRRYSCSDVLDTVIWKTDGDEQQDVLDPAYKAILTEFSDRFVAGMDYGGGRPPLPRFIESRAKNLRLIMRGLPESAKRNIGYRNAWKLLTGKAWREISTN